MQKNSVLADALNCSSTDSFSVQNYVQNSKLQMWKEKNDMSKPKHIFYLCKLQ